jgi:hypothetical protein
MERLSTGERFRMSQSLILVDALFLLDMGKRRGEKKERKEREIIVMEEGFPGAGPSLLAVLWLPLLGAIKG